MSSVKEGEEYVIEPPGAFSLNVKELWQYRELFYFFAWRDVKVKYKQTTLGFLWVILQPLAMMLIFTFFLGQRLNLASESIPYPLFVLSGLLLWNVFSSGVTSGSNSMFNNAAIIKKIYFPRLIITFSVVLVSLFDFLILLTFFLVGVLLFAPQFHFFQALLAWPLAIIITVVATLGVGTWLAALTLKYRDFRYIIPFAIQVLLFVSPILYPVNFTNPWLNYLFALNPVTVAVSLFRVPFNGVMPEVSLIGLGMLSALIFFVYGIYYFKKTELFFADLA